MERWVTKAVSELHAHCTPCGQNLAHFMMSLDMKFQEKMKMILCVIENYRI